MSSVKVQGTEPTFGLYALAGILSDSFGSTAKPQNGIESFRTKCKKLLHSKPEICLIDWFFYPAKERNNSLFLERNDR